MGRRGRRRRTVGGPAGDGPGPEFGALFLPLALQNLLLTYTSTAMNVALSAIVRDLHTTLIAVQSAISLYSLVVAASLIAASKIGARHGYQRTFVFGAGVFAVGTLVTALAPNMAFMLVGWPLLQGIGVALMLPALLSLLTEALSGATRTRALSALGTIGGIGAAAGPLLGGFITHYSSWRVSFLMGTVVTVAVMLLMRRAAEAESPPARPGQRFDVAGALLSAAGVGLLVVAILLAGWFGLLRARHDVEVFGHTLFHRGGLSPVPVLAGIGLVVLAAFAVWERHLVERGRDPLVRLSVLRNRTVRAGTQTQAMQYLVPNGALFLVPVFLQTTLGFDALRCGVTLLPTTLGLMLTAAPAARLVAAQRMTHRAAQMWSFLFLLAGCVVVAALFDPRRGITATGLALAPGLFLVGVGQGLATTVTDLIQSAAPPDEVSDVTGLSRSGTYLGSSLGVALAGAVMTTTLLHSFESRTDGSTVLTSTQKELTKEALERQVQITAATDQAVRAKLEARGVAQDASQEVVRINAYARERALTLGVACMAALAAAGCLVASRIPRVRTRAPRPR
ncbi:MFS transporter [Streptomyces sp. NPDC005526]|uniref:MFS transporter n=1 Tax=Streptomyces sp. NPDC005526 TaxID=3156885 RepID=UPI0033A3BAA6